jgi:hypothetical protein
VLQTQKSVIFSNHVVAKRHTTHNRAMEPQPSVADAGERTQNGSTFKITEWQCHEVRACGLLSPFFCFSVCHLPSCRYGKLYHWLTGTVNDSVAARILSLETVKDGGALR